MLDAFPETRKANGKSRNCVYKIGVRPIFKGNENYLHTHDFSDHLASDMSHEISEKDFQGAVEFHKQRFLHGPHPKSTATVLTSQAHAINAPTITR